MKASWQFGIVAGLLMLAPWLAMLAAAFLPH